MQLREVGKLVAYPGKMRWLQRLGHPGVLPPGAAAPVSPVPFRARERVPGPRAPELPARGALLPAGWHPQPGGRGRRPRAGPRPHSVAF